MPKYNQDLVVPANNDISLRFEVINEATGLIVPATDIEGASWAMSPLEEEVAPLVTKDLIGGGITVPEDGVVVVALLGSDTVGLSGEFSHELRLRDAGGVRTAARGRITIKYQISANPL